MKGMRANHRPAVSPGERGTTYIELAMMSVIAGILLVSLSQAITSTTKGAIAAKERARAQSLAQDRLEEIKNLGYSTLQLRVSRYWYPDQPDPDNPLMQAAIAKPYPAVMPLPGEDPWTPEVILVGKRSYWRHVKVKFVEPDPDVAGSGQLVQAPKPSPGGYPTPGGTSTGSNLAFIEVDVTWFSIRMGRMEQIRIATMLANPNAMNAVASFCTISGTVIDTGALPELGGLGDSEVRDSDDRAISWAALVVMARNILTGEKYTTKVDTSQVSAKAYGFYQFLGIPAGAYEVLVYGAPKYLDGGFNGKSTIADEYNPTVSVTVNFSNTDAKFTNIWLRQTKLVKIYGRFSGVDGTSGGPKTVQVYNNDYSSVPTEVGISATTNCTPAMPCWFVLNDVAWPATGKVLWKTMIVNLTDKVGIGATLCADAAVVSPASATDFYVGTVPLSNPCSAGCQADFPGLGTDCVYPGETGSYTPFNLAANFKKPTLKVKVMEYYDNGEFAIPPSVLPMVRVGFLSTNDGISATLGVNSDSTTIFINLASGDGLVPIQPAPSIKVSAWATTTGYMADNNFLSFNTQPGSGMVPPNVDYNLIPLGGGAQPSDESARFNFRLIRISSVSGTVWMTEGIKGYPNAAVGFTLQSADWNNVVNADGSGRFVHSSVPVNTKAGYVVAPIAGSDYIATPVSRVVEVKTNGILYDRDKDGNPLTFVLTAINGVIKGNVYKGGVPVTEGAVVVASTYNGAFPLSLPSALLANAYTYSTVTYTDGSFKMKVGTGLGSYYMYAYTMQGGSEASCAQCQQYTAGSCSASAPIVVNPDSEVKYDICIP